MKPRAKKGDIVRLRFLDHVEGADEPLEFFAYGRVFLATRDAYVVDNWCYPAIDHSDRSDNINRFTILRKVISEVIIYGDVTHGREGRQAEACDTGRSDELG